MSDPLSATASAAGLVSLGIQVVSGITKYLDAIRERKNDIASVKTQVIRTQELLRLVLKVATKAEPNHSTAAAFLKDSASVQLELQALDEFVRKLDTTKFPLPSHEVLGKAYVQAKKLTYPFHRPTMERLRSRLIQVNYGLHAALQVSGLDVALDIERTTSAIKTMLPDLAGQLSDNIKQENLASRDAVARVGDSVVSLSGNFDQGLVKVLEGIATTNNVSVSALKEDHADKHSQLLQKLSAAHNAVSSLNDAVQDVDMGMVKIREDIATTSTTYVLLLRQVLAETQERVLQELAETRSGVTEVRDSFKRFDSRFSALATREELGRLISKPGQLKDLCDTMEETIGPTPSRDPNRRPRINLTRRICVCRKRVIRSRQTLLWGPWQALADTSTAHDHLPDCIFYSQDAVVPSKRLAVAFKGLQGLVNRAVEVSFSYSFGAGGCSLSPGFTYYPTIDHRRDPAFRIMRLLNKASSPSYRHRLSNIGDFLEQCLENIALLYRHGKASPKAVDMQGSGVLHYFFYSSAVGLTCAMTTFDELFVNRRHQNFLHRKHLLNGLDALVKHGIQTDMYDIWGACVESSHPFRLPQLTALFLRHSTPAFNMIFQRIAPWFNVQPGCFVATAAPTSLQMASPLSDFLCAREPGVPIATKSMLKHAMYGMYGNARMVLCSLMRSSIATAEAFGCGPLSLAVLDGDVKKMEVILKNCPSAINELNLLEQTPLHLAVGHPSCVTFLLRGSGGKLIDLRDSGGRRPIEYAMFSCMTCMYGTRPGENQHHDGCLNNHGDTSLNIILDADCMIPAIQRWPREGYATLCDNCVRAVSAHLVSRREDLKKLASNNVPRMQATALGIFCSSLFDSNASRAIQALRQRGISVPPSLQVDELSWRDSISPYQFQDCPLPLPAIWRLGFHDLDTPSLDGLTPLMQCCEQFHRDTRRKADRCSWLIENGADLWKLAPDGISTIGHELYSSIGQLGDTWERDANGSQRHVLFNLTRKLSHQDPRDNCRCSCSPGGCTPFVRYLQRARRRAYTDWGMKSISVFVEHFPRILMGTHMTVTKVQVQSAVRYATFEMLGIRHTCCHAKRHAFCYSHGSHRQDEELDELRQEDRFLVAWLEDLVADFELELEHIGQESYVNKCVSFWHGYWLPRMQQVLESIEGARIEKSEKAAAEEVGVVWHEQETVKGKDRDEGFEFDCDAYSESEDGGHHESDWDSDTDEEGMFRLFQTMGDSDSDTDEEGMFRTFQTMEDWTSKLDLIMSKAGLSAGR